MGARFKPIWADTTMARKICYPYRYYFFIELAIGIVIFIIFNSKIKVIDAGFGLLPDWLMRLCLIFDGVFLPRSLIELPAIRNVYGDWYFYCATLMFLLCSLTGICIIFFIYVKSRLILISESMSKKQNSIRFFVAFGFLILQIPQFERGPIAADYVDSAGLFFIKSSIIIGVGYYNLCLIVVDFVGRYRLKNLCKCSLPLIRTDDDYQKRM